jgi:hypothetical protein
MSKVHERTKLPSLRQKIHIRRVLREKESCLFCKCLIPCSRPPSGILLHFSPPRSIAADKQQKRRQELHQRQLGQNQSVEKPESVDLLADYLADQQQKDAFLQKLELRKDNYVM